MSQQSGPLYGGENPANPEIVGIQTSLREAIDGVVLDEDTSFNDKLYILEASQRDVFEPFRGNPIVDRLQEASRGIMMFSLSGALVVGRLDQENPWSFTELTKGQYVDTRIGMSANFICVRLIKDTLIRPTTRFPIDLPLSETIPVVERMRHRSLDVRLPLQPVGSEHLYTKVETFSDQIFAGEMDIHAQIAELQKDKSEQERAALHGAFTVAASEVQ